MKNYKLLETVADIAYYAGEFKFYSGDSRSDMHDFILWAMEFQELHKQTNWDENDYMDLIEEFALRKIETAFADMREG